MVVLIGIDVSKDKHDCFILNSEGEVLADASKGRYDRDKALASREAARSSIGQRMPARLLDLLNMGGMRNMGEGAPGRQKAACLPDRLIWVLPRREIPRRHR